MNCILFSYQYEIILLLYKKFYLQLALVGESLFISAFWTIGVLEIFGVVRFDKKSANISLSGTDEVNKLIDLEYYINKKKFLKEKLLPSFRRPLLRV